MKTLIIFFSICFVQQFFAQETATSSVTVIVENLSNNEGTVQASLYVESNFLKAKPEFTSGSDVKDGKATLHFENVPEGIYGITVFHDENGNNQMDFDARGMPLENYGISNNKFNPYGPPVWSDARFELGAVPVTMNITLSR